jgi:hypothetical protein
VRLHARAFKRPELLLELLHAPQVVLMLVWSRVYGHRFLPLEGALLYGDPQAVRRVESCP